MEKPADRTKPADPPAGPILFSWPPLGLPQNMSVGHELKQAQQYSDS